MSRAVLFNLIFVVFLNAKILIRKPFYGDPPIDKLTLSVAREYLNCDLFFTPISVALGVNPGEGDDTTMVFYVTDADWNRIVYMRIGDRNIYALGTRGSGVNQFHFPLGICADAYNNVYVADYMNGRYVKLHYDLSSSHLVWDTAVTYCLDAPLDVDVDYRSTDTPEDDYIWVLDFQSKLLMFDRNGILRRLLCLEGVSIGAFLSFLFRPTELRYCSRTMSTRGFSGIPTPRRTDSNCRAPIAAFRPMQTSLLLLRAASGPI